MVWLSPCIWLLFLEGHPGCGGASDSSARARFRNYVASRVLMTNAIGVAKTIIANRSGIAFDTP